MSGNIIQFTSAFLAVIIIGTVSALDYAKVEEKICGIPKNDLNVDMEWVIT
jgi:uncharacterized membrane protein YiaA